MVSNRVSAYLDYLPALFRQDPVLGAFLLAFERLYIGTGQSDDDDILPGVDGFEPLIDQIPSYFEPLGEDGRTPAGMLPWLASWIGASLSEDWPEETRRLFLQQAMPLYQKRGTPAGLGAMLEIYLGRAVEVEDQREDFPPFYFEVTIRLDSSDPKVLAEVDRVARSIIDREKPGHTCYGLNLLLPSMHLVSQPEGPADGVIVGETTLLGTDNG